MASFNGSPLLSSSFDSEQQPTQGLEEAQAELERLIESLSTDGAGAPSFEAKNGNGKRDAAYLMLSSMDGLTKKHGQLGFSRLDQDLQEFKQAIEGNTGLKVITIYVDDDSSLTPYGLQPVDPANPVRVKALIDALDTHLNKQDQEIQYVLIVGGDSIIPFHRLPNPLDDQDEEVLSDNPYASRDSNYFIPERAVGRMPDGEGEGIDFLRSLIQTAIDGHQRPSTNKGLLSDLLGILWPTGQDRENGDGHGQGYSASIWRKASRAVFEIIGDNRHLRTSPPLTCEEFKLAEGPHFGYFNLHGIEDGPNWYGQRDSLFPADYPLFPVALRPEDLAAVENADAVVFTEACYGANILEKGTDTSIALRFLASRALALIGSTKIAYGSVAPPLLGADLIGKHFWQGLQAHLTIGEALKYAKVKLAKEMQDRQGYLDGEDQKTLISFVLYGDPSLPATAIRNGMEEFSSKSFRPFVICRNGAKAQKGIVSEELVAKVKSCIEANLPHMAQAQVHAAPLKLCTGNCGHLCGHTCETTKVAKGPIENWALTLEKDLPVEGDGKHRQVVRVTVDGQGHILKMAISK
jgi:hypothetical protein